jgi:2-haloacid dehalogenase
MADTIPMPNPTVQPLPLVEYKVLSFDIYGTIIEYKAHILRSFAPLLGRLAQDSPYLNDTPLAAHITGSATQGSVEFLKLFQRHEDAIKLELGTQPRRFDHIMQEIWRRIAAELAVDTTDVEVSAFGSKETIASWPTFDGTFDALSYLSTRFRLVALSNIDKFAWNITAASDASSLGEILWWKVFTAEDFGTDMKKADDAKLETLIDHVCSKGFDKSQILHVAQSLGHDHAPAKRNALSSVFLIGDGPIWGKEAESKMTVEKELVGYAWRCKDLREFAQIVQQAFAAKTST